MAILTLAMSEAEDLRDLALKLEDLTRSHRASSMALPYVRMLTDLLVMRARVMDLERDNAALRAAYAKRFEDIRS
jgi:hypothetical protein